MAKAAVSSGGGGSNGAAMTFMEELVEEARQEQPPADAFTLQQFMAMAGLQYKPAQTFLDAKAKEGKIIAKKFSSRGRPPRWFYWPATAQKPRAK